MALKETRHHKIVRRFKRHEKVRHIKVASVPKFGTKQTPCPDIYNDYGTFISTEVCE